MDKIYKLLHLIQNGEEINQRELAGKTGLSVGTVNSLLKNMEKENYIKITKTNNKKSYSLTDTGIGILEAILTEQKSIKLGFNNKSNNNIDTAVILAAGRTKDFDFPVGLIDIGEKKIIDRIINILNNCNIKNIILVVGYKKELYFEHFKDSNVQFVENNKFKFTGTMHSLSLAKDMVNSDFILIESDQIFEERAISEILNSKQKVNLLVANPSGSGDEAYVELDESGNIYRISKDTHQLNNINGEMLGISKISLELYKKMLKQFSSSHNPYINYEYVIENIGRLYDIKPYIIDDLLWGEIDDLVQKNNTINIIYPKIKRKEKEMKKIYATNILKQILSVEDQDIQEISFSGGLTNTNYKTRIKDDEYILRIPGLCTEEMITRPNERYNGKLASLIGINCNIIYFNENTGIKLSQYISGAQTLNQKTAKYENNFLMTAEILKKLHMSRIEFNNNFNVFDEIEKYENIMYDNKNIKYDNYNQIREKIMNFKNVLNDIGLNIVCCHNDLVPENLVKSDTGRMYLIDWEYSGMNDPMWDLAANIIECNFDEDTENLFLNYYFGTLPNRQNLEKILIFKICQDFLWAIWTSVKEERGDNFGSYGQDRFNRCLKNISIWEEKYNVEK